jgi:hypothetical protein
MKTHMILIAAVIGILAGTRLLAHHSFAAQYDPSKAIYVDVKEENGQVTTWGCEGAASGQLSRRGFKKGDAKIGDTIVIDGYRARDGSHLMDARRITLADGRIVAGGSAGDGGPQ